MRCVAPVVLTRTSPQPTNHLDMDAIDALIQGLAMYKGGVLLVSHDQHFISAVADELWCVRPAASPPALPRLLTRALRRRAVEGDGNVRPFEGTFEEYKKGLRKQR